MLTFTRTRVPVLTIVVIGGVTRPRSSRTELANDRRAYVRFSTPATHARPGWERWDMGRTSHTNPFQADSGNFVSDNCSLEVELESLLQTEVCIRANL